MKKAHHKHVVICSFLFLILLVITLWMYLGREESNSNPAQTKEEEIKALMVGQIPQGTDFTQEDRDAMIRHLES